MTGPQKPRVDDDDDLDDLDDVLDQFSPQTQPIPPQPLPSAPSTSARASTSTQPISDGEDGISDDFAAQLAEDMASLFKDLGVDPSVGAQGPDGAAERDRQLSAAWEAMLAEGMNAMSTPDPSGASTSVAKDSDGDFKSRIRSTMHKLKESESDLKSSTDGSASGGAETLESLLSQLQGLGDLGEGDESEEQLQGVLEDMMGQLMGKDVLYEPLKELHDKFPDYLARNSSTISSEDKQRFDAQISCIKQLLAEFEAKTYSDEDEQVREKIVALMGELQTHGSPPDEIMGPLPPGFSMGSDGLPNMPDGCIVS